MKLKIWLLAALTALGTAFAEELSPEMQQLEAALRYQQGAVELLDGAVRLETGTQFRYLSALDAGRLLTEGWGNPSGAGTLGMLVPAGLSPLSGAGWAVVLTYDEDGYISDKEASAINYDKLLGDMQRDTESSNAARKDAGREAIHLVGWATPPRYDAASHKLYWAKELDFEGSRDHTLNYDLRVLGRRGVLNLNAVAAIGQLAQVEAATPAILQTVSFTPGHRYEDYNPATDKLAEYGLTALIAGGAAAGVAAKTGLFAKLLLLLVGLKKFAVVIVVGVIALLGRLFGGKSAATE